MPLTVRPNPDRMVRESRLLTTGLLDPVPVGSRLLPLPGVMSSPPTHSAGSAGAASTITSGVTTTATYDSGGGVFVLRDPAPWRFLNANMVVKGQTFPSRNHAVSANVQGVATSGWYRVEFMFDGTAFEVLTSGQAGSVRRYMVDGAYVDSTPYASYPIDGQSYYEKLTFASRATRHIVIECAPTFCFGGLVVGPADTVWVPESPIGPRVMVMGDSYIGGTGSDGGFMSISGELGKLMGWRNVWATGMGGTGYIADNSGTAVPFASRVQTDVIAPDPDVVIIYGGQNDLALTPANVQAAAASLYATIKAALPRVPLVVVGPQFFNGQPNANMIQVRDAIRAACDPKKEVRAGYALVDNGSGLVDLYIDPLGGPVPYDGTISHYVDVGWITGTGNAASPSGSGNADSYRRGTPDNSHPTQAGHEYYARRIAAAIVAALPL